MLATVHLADVGGPSALAELRRNLDVAAVPGLHWASTVVGAPLGTSGLAARPKPGRLGLIALWQDLDAAERFETSHPLPARLRHGWRTRLTVVNAHEYHRSRGSAETGSWPGVPDDVTAATPIGGPVAVLTLARTRMTRLPRLLRATQAAGRPLRSAPGFLWGTAIARPPIIATFTLLADEATTESYAYGSSGHGHATAMAMDRAGALHHAGVFFRFAPTAVTGALGGRHPLPADLLATPPPVPD